MTQIFATLAPSYWAAGLNAIPLWSGEKRPSINAWQELAFRPVTEGEKARWLSEFPVGNIGLALGQHSGMVMIDIDTEEPALLTLLQKLLPPSPWCRVGRKGYMLAYKWTPGARTFRIKRSDGSMIVEHLSDRTQCVLPGSIHPDTKLPYTANCDLYDPEVLSGLNTLPPDFEAILRAGLEEAGVTLSISGHTKVTDYVAPGSRDVQMIAVAGHYANGILRGELSFNEAIGRMVAWHSTCVEKVAGDDIDITKGIGKLAAFVINDVLGPKKKSLPEGWDAGMTPPERTAFGFDVFTEENIAWDYEHMKAYIKEAFLLHDPESLERRQAVDYLLERIAHSKIDKVDEDRLLKYIVNAGSMGISLAPLRALLHEMRHGGLSGVNHAELAEAFLTDLEKIGVTAYSGGNFWQWRGSHWEKLEAKDLRVRIAKDFGHLPAAKKNQDYNGILAIAADLAGRNIKVSSEEGVNFANGFLTLDMELREHSPDFGCTYTLPYRYLRGEENRATKFFDFLESCWGEEPDFEQKKMALAEAMATTLFGIAPRFERAILLQGNPSSGKSQLLKIMMALVPGEVIAAVPPEDWSDRFLPAQLYGKLLNVAGELHETKNIDGKRFKEIVSGEKITGQRKQGQPFEFQPMCAHWFASNHLPKTTDTSIGFTRRWLLFTFSGKVKAKQKILELGTLIAAEEREYIASWAVEAITRVQKGNEYTLSPSHVQRLNEVATANNSLRMFLESGIYIVDTGETSSSATIPEMTLFNAYYTFAATAGVAKPVNLNGFRQKMRELGSELGFSMELKTLPQGGQDCYYGNLTLANSNVVKLRASK